MHETQRPQARPLVEDPSHKATEGTHPLTKPASGSPLEAILAVREANGRFTHGRYNGSSVSFIPEGERLVAAGLVVHVNSELNATEQLGTKINGVMVEFVADGRDVENPQIVRPSSR